MEKNYRRVGETLYRAKLGNGLDIYVVPRPEYSKAYAFFATNYGGMDMRYRMDGEWKETPAGVAHFLEHKMFDTKDGNALQELAANGASPNAFTSTAMTAYHFESTEKFEDNLRVLLRFVSVPYFTPESVQKEQGIIGQEIQMIEDDPNFRAYNGLMAALYREHPVRVSVAGSAESISHITADTLYQCHRAFYHPSNMALCVVGDVDPEHVREIAEKILPPEGGAPIERDYGPGEAKEAFQPRAELEMAVSTPIFLIGYKNDPSPRGPEYLRRELTARLACEALFGESSPLYARLYEKGLINRNFGGDFEAMEGCAFVAVGGESRDPDAVREEIQKETLRIGREGLSGELYERLKRAAFGNRLRELNSFDLTCVRMAEAHFHGADYFEFPEIFDGIARADVERYIAENIVPARTAISVVLPKGGRLK